MTVTAPFPCVVPSKDDDWFFLSLLSGRVNAVAAHSKVTPAATGSRTRGHLVWRPPFASERFTPTEFDLPPATRGFARVRGG